MIKGAGDGGTMKGIEGVVERGGGGGDGVVNVILVKLSPKLYQLVSQLLMSIRTLKL